MQPPAALLIGPSGSGKTSAIATQLLGGLEVFVIVTEPDGVASLVDSCERLKAPMDKLHWTEARPAAMGWSGLEDMISKINSMDQKGLSEVRDMGKSDFRAAGMHFLAMLKNFHCQRTGKDFGDVTLWDDSRSLNIDSLSGWCAIAWGVTVGYKPTANPGEWGIGQNFIENMLKKINNDRKCFFSLTAHMEKEMDEVLGVKRLTVSAIGAKLAPKIPPFFSEVIRTSRTMNSNGGAEFTWSTLASDMDLKNRALPIAAKMPADFRQIIDVYKRRKELASGSVAAATDASPAKESVASAPPLPIAPMSPATAAQQKA